MTNTFPVRIQVQGDAAARTALEQIGQTGERSFGQLFTATTRVSGALNKTEADLERARRKVEALKPDPIANLGRALSDAGTQAKRHADQVQDLSDKYNPLAARLREVEKSQTLVNTGLQLGTLQAGDAAKLQARLSDEHRVLSKAMAGTGAAAKLTYTDIEVLRAGGVNLVQTLAAGGNAAAAFQTQLFQTAPALPNLARSMGLASVAGLGLVAGIGLLVAGFGTLAYGAYRAYESQRQIDIALRNSAGAAGVTKDQVNALALSVASYGQLSVSEARGAATAFVAHGQVIGDNVAKATRVLADYAAFTGQSMAEAGKDLEKSLNDPTAAAKNLAATFRGSLSDAQIQAIAEMQRAGNQAGAQAAYLAAVEARAKGAGEQLNGLAKAWRAVSNFSSNFVSNIVDTPTDDSEAARIRGERSKAAARLRVLNDQGDTTSIEAEDLEVRIIALDAKLKPIEARIAVAKQDAAQAGATATANAASVLAGDYARGVNAAEQKLKELKEKRDAILKGQTLAFDSDGGTVENLGLAYDRLTRAITTYLTPAQRASEQARIDAEVLKAPIAAREDLRIKLETQLGLAGQEVAAGEAQVIVNAKLSSSLSARAAASRDAIAATLSEAFATRARTLAVAEGGDAVLKAQAFEQARFEMMRDGAAVVDVAARAESLLAEAIAKRGEAAAQALAQAKQQTALLGDQARAAAINDPQDRRRAEQATERQAKLIDLQRQFGSDQQAINDQLREFDAQAASRGYIQYYDDLRAKASRVSDDISQFLVDGFVNAGQGGKSAFQNLWDGAWAGAKRLIANIAAEFLKTQFIMPIVQSVMGSSGSLFGLTAPGGAAGAGGASSVGGTISGFASIGNLLTNIGKIFSNPGTLLGSAQAGIDAFGFANLGFSGGSVAVPAGTLPAGTGILAGSGGASYAGVASSAGTSLSGVLGAAGIGSLGGMLAQLTGIAHNGYGGFVGAGIGAIAALIPALSSVAGPIGLAVGLLASLFGPSKQHVAGSVALGYDPASVKDGSFTGLWSGDPHSKRMDISALDGELQTVVRAVTQVIEAMGGKVKAFDGGYRDASGNPTYGYVGYNEDSKKWDVTIGGNTFSSVDEKDIAAVVLREELRYLNKSGGITGFSDTQKAIIGSDAFGATRDTNQIQKYLDFGSTYDDIIKLANGTKDYGKTASQVSQTLTALDKYFADAKSTAEELGLSVEQFATASEKAREKIGSGFIEGLQDQIDALQGKGFLKSLREFSSAAKQTFDDLDELFAHGAITQSQFDSGRALASALQAGQAAVLLAGLTNSQLDAIISGFADDTTVFGQAVEAAAEAIRHGTAIAGAAGVDQSTFWEKIQFPLQERLLNAISAVDPALKSRNDQAVQDEKRRLEVQAAIRSAIGAQATQGQLDWIRAQYAQIYLYEDLVDAATKAQGALGDAIKTVADFGKTVDDYVNKASVDEYSGKSPKQILEETRAQFDAVFARAQSGEGDALGQVTSYAQNYRKAISTYYGGGVQGTDMSQNVLDQVSALAKSSGLAVDLANWTLRQNGNGNIQINGAGGVTRNGQWITGLAPNPTAAGVAAFGSLASRYAENMSADAYRGLATDRDALLRTLSDSSLQAISNSWYGGRQTGGLNNFLDFLHQGDQGWLSSHGGLGGQAANDNIFSAGLSASGAIATAVSAAHTTTHADLTSLVTALNAMGDRVQASLVGAGGVTASIDAQTSLLHGDLGASLGPALAAVPALAETVKQLASQIAGLAAENADLKRQLIDTQMAVARAIDDGNDRVVAAQRQTTQALANANGPAGMRAA